MSGSLRKFAPRREHKERSQLRGRKRLGLLEKHKDYVLRAKDHKDKQKQLKRLRERAAARNPDEFYFNMERSQVKDGVHIEERKEAMTVEMERLMETQDIKYIRMQRDINRRKIEKLENELHLADASSQDEVPQHTVFVDSEKDVERFDAAKHFGTLPEFVGRKYNRPTIEALGNSEIARPSGSVLKKAVETREARLRELKDRLEREQKLKRVEAEMQLRKALKEKGKKVKVGTDQLGLAVYKWKAERKR
ncbi:hypothetical protein IW140_005395 [Coemansia sp. RSA 1813]|nr:hypothetical protein EV178_005487 [Coemansia sp. RSA 1646]KAJ1769023.1 hypothetical protein LPJ74_004387 [Coemansia sp. RSA 1843]KAJ2086651.1 hypothetical protein IW138_005522 [Coemansia sp. RSA 986]KAJ2211440.1 hypothetical protein EV179_005482 [Coemansia sp. RSA 487]KAJ2565282.1 hypothetical protein IW140_005395 [Coemansia sp. RSA 1813]